MRRSRIAALAPLAPLAALAALAVCARRGPPPVPHAELDAARATTAVSTLASTSRARPEDSAAISLAAASTPPAVRPPSRSPLAIRANPLALRPPPSAVAPAAPTKIDASPYHAWDPKAATLRPLDVDLSTTWRTSPGKRAVAIYRYARASDWDYAVEIFEAKTRVTIFPQVRRLEVGPRAALLWLDAADLDASGRWMRSQRIADVDAGTSTPLVAPCGVAASWSADRLVQWGATSPMGGLLNETTICVHAPDGRRVATLDAKLLWHAASSEFLSAELGVLPKDHDVLWLKELDEAQACTLHLQSLTDPTRRASVPLRSAAEGTHCAATETDLAEVTLDAPKVLFRPKDENGDWLPWRTTQ